MKILFADKFAQTYIDTLEAAGHRCHLQTDLDADSLPAAIRSYEVLVVRSTRVTDATFNNADALKLVIRAGAGTNTIDKLCAREKGIHVCNVPGKNALAVAELTLGLLISIDRNIPDNVYALRSKQWNKTQFSATQGLFGRKMGIIGIGSIGLAVASRAKAFGIDLFVLKKPSRAPATQAMLDELAVVELADMNELVATCDIFSFHVPSNDETKAMVNANFLEKVQPGSVILNTSRGEVIDEAALIAAMDSKGVRAGLDVFCNEPSSGVAQFNSALAVHPNVYGTHHIGASTTQAQNAVALGVLDVIKNFEQNKIINCVN